MPWLILCIIAGYHAQAEKAIFVVYLLAAG